MDNTPELHEDLRDNDTDPILTIMPGQGEDKGFVAIWMRNCPLGILNENLTPGARVSPEDARHIASQLLYFANLVEEESSESKP